MRLALSQAFLGMRKNHGGPFGAVIARKGRVIAKAHNQVLKTKDPTAHAEIISIRKASSKLKRFDLSDCDLYSSCEPCPMCLSAIYWAKIPKVYFGCTKEDAEKIGFVDKLLYDVIRNKARGGVKKLRLERRECLKSFREWGKKKDKVRY